MVEGADTHNPGYFLPILVLFWAISDCLQLNAGYFPPMHRHIVTVSASPGGGVEGDGRGVGRDGWGSKSWERLWRKGERR